jgi:REP element-mobilizing transposase RayT
MIHNRKRNRLAGYDYSIPGYYFVTICTKGMLEYFGRGQNNKMLLNDAGRMVKKWFNRIPDKYSSICCHTFCVMPNHVHTIIQIVGIDPRVCPDKNMVNTQEKVNTQERVNTRVHPYGDVSLSDIVQWFKTMTTNEYIRNVKLHSWKPFDRKLWQRSFYDHIIRNDEKLIRISDYIEKNPLLWKQDEYFIELEQ